MSKSNWTESRIERAVVWFLRIILLLLLFLAVVDGEYGQALALLAILLSHGALYLVVPRLAGDGLPWILTAADTILGGMALYLTILPGGLATLLLSDELLIGSFLGFCLVAIMATRFSLWQALIVNAAIWLLFSAPFLYLWLGLDEPFPSPIVGNMVIYLILTFSLSYLAAMEARQTRISDHESQRLQQLTTVFEVGQTITSSLEMDTVLDLVLTKAVEILNAEAGSLLLLDPQSDELVFRVVSGPVAHELEGQRLDRGAGIAGQVLETGQGRIVNDVQSNGHWTEAPDAATGFQTHSILCVPLVSRGRPLGVLEIVNKRNGNPFDEQDLELLSVFAAQSAVALENARLYEQTDEALGKRVQELATIEEIDHELGSSLDYDRIIDLVLERAAQACQADMGAIGIVPPEQKHLEVRYWHAREPVGDLTPDTIWPTDRGIVGRVLRSGEPVLVDDVDLDPDYEAVVAPTRSELAVPIKREERVIGVLNLESNRPAAFSQDDLHFMEHLADHAGIAITNARLFQEERRRAADLATLNQVSAAVSSVLDPEEVLKTILDSVIQVTGCQKAAIFVLEADRAHLRMSHGLSDQYVAEAQDIEVHSDSRAQVLLGDEPLVVTDIEADPGLAHFVPLARREGFQALVDLPLQGRTANVGELTVYYSEPRDFSSVELDTIKTFANQAAIALENARLFETERQRVQTLSAISAISREIRTGLDLERTLDLILTRVKDLADYTIAEICLWDAKQELMVTWASGGDTRYTARTGGIYQLDEGFTGWIARHQQQLLIPDIAARSDVQPKAATAETPLRSYVGLPLRTGDTFVGTLEMASDQLGAYTESQVEILKIMADQAAIAIRNAQLYQETQERFEQTQLLLQVSEAIGSTLDLTETVRQVARQMCRALEADMAGVYLANEAGTHLQAVAGYHIPKDKLEFYAGFEVPITGHPFIREAWDSHHAVYSLDPANDPRIDRATIKAFPNETTLFAPMVARDEVIGGVYLIWTTEKREFSQEEMQMADAIAWQAGAVVENARLFEDQQRRLRELGMLFEASSAISSSLELNEVLRTVGRQVASALNVSSCSISDWNRQANVVQTLIDEDLVPDTSPSDVGKTYSLETYGTTARVLHSRQAQVVHIDDPEADLAERQLLQELNYKSVLMLPMIARDTVIGLMELFESRHVRQFSDEDVRLAQTLSNQAAIAIENARLYEQTDERLRARLDELTALQRTTQKLNATLALDDILQVVLESAIQTTRATHGNVMLTDLDSGQLVLRATQGYSPEEQGQIEEMLLDPDGDSLTLQVVQSGEARIVDDARQESCTVCVRLETCSALVVPIFYEHTVVGLINLRHTEVGAFDAEERTFVESLAEQAAIAIGNALRFEDQRRANTTLRQRTEQMGRLLEVGQQLRADVPLEDTLEEIAYAIQETVGFNVVLISICEGTPPTMQRVAAAGLPLHTFREMAKIRQPVERYERLLREEYRQGLCYFYPFQKREDWEAELHTHAPMAAIEEWHEGEWHPNDMLLAPLRGSGGRLLGIISVDEPREGRRPARQTREALAIFANQAAIAVENAILYADAQQRADRLAMINEVGQSLSRALEPDQVGNTVVRAVSEVLNCETSAIFQLDERDEAFAPIASHGIALAEIDGLRFATGQGIVGHVVATATPLLIPDTEQDPRFVDGPAPIGSMLCVPMVAGRQVIGALTAGNSQRQAFGQADQVLLTTLADQAAVALESARLFARTQQAAVRLSLLNVIGRQSAAELDLQEMLDTSVRALQQNLGYFRVAVLLVDQEAEELYVAAANDDFWKVIPPDYRQKIGQGLIGSAAARGETIRVNEQYADTEMGRAPSSLSVPIKLGNRVTGILEVESEQPWAFTEEDAAALEIAADQLAVAIRNAQLFEDTQTALAESQALYRVTRSVISFESLTETLQTVVDGVAEALPADQVALCTIDLDERRVTSFVTGGNDCLEPQPVDFDELWTGLSGWVLRETKPALSPKGVPDPRESPELQKRRAEMGSGAIVVVPVLYRDRILGTMTAVNHVDQPDFVQRDVDLMVAMANQAAVAIENTQLFEETQRRVAELATINEIGRAISSALDLEQLSEMIYTQVSKLLDTRNFHIALYDEKAQQIRVEFLMENGERQPAIVLNLGQGLTSYLIENGNPILLGQGTDDFLRQHNLTLEREPAKSWLGVPMVLEDRVIGAIAVQSFDQEQAFDQGHLNLLATVATQAAVAFQNATLFEERERRITDLAVINEMSRAISASLKLDDLLETVHQQIDRLFDTTNFYIATYQEAKEEWTLAFALEHGQQQPRARYKVASGLTGHIIRSREPVLLSSREQSIAFHQEHNIDSVGEQARSWMGVPLIAADQVVGVMAIQSYQERGLYNEQDLALFSTIAAQTAAAVRNAQLYQQIVRFSGELEDRVEARTRDLEEALTELTVERDRVETLHRITSELGTTLELERVLQRALQLFADALGVTHGTIMLLDQESRYLDLRASLQPVEVGIVAVQGQTPEDYSLIEVGDQTPLKPGVGLAGWTLQNREPTLVPDIEEDARWIDLPGRELGIRSAIAAPLSLGGGDILGVLTLGHPEIDYFDEEHVKLVTAAAAQIAMAVNNSDLYAFITDQADQLGSMLQAQQSEAAKNQAVLESIADGVLVLDHNGRVLLINPAAEELLGISAKALEGDHFRYMLGMGETPAQRDLAQGLYTELRRRLETPDREESLSPTSTVRLTSRKKALAVNIAPLITTIGDAPGVVAALRDISREVEVERIKNEFISTVSHELRTPMTSIKGYTDLLFLGMAGGLSDAQRNFLQIIKSNADRLTALVNDILDISRIETGRIRLNIESLDLNDIVSQVILAFQEQYREKGIELAWQENEELPEIRGDKDRVTQILNNLVANAWQYTLPEGTVRVSIHELDGFLQVDIADTGIGISEEDVARIFDRFYRVDDPVVEEAGGTGLGLSIVKMFVDMLGGRIWVESKQGKGSTFSFTLPLSTADVPEIVPDLLTTEPSATISRRPQILVVEDDRDLALLLRRQLESEGYQVLLAGSGEDALWLAKEEQPQLITLDVMLPDIDGFVVLERLKEHPATAPIPVVIVSVLTEEDQGYALGAIDYVVKPFSEDKLLNSIRQALAPKDEKQVQNILVVDDDADIRGFLEEALSYHGYHIDTAANGQEALDQVAEKKPDLVLLDIKMPGMDGYEVIRRLKGEDSTRAIPVIVITASPVDQERDKVRVLGMGAAQYITKPLSIEDLVSEITTAIAERTSE